MMDKVHGVPGFASRKPERGGRVCDGAEGRTAEPARLHELREMVGVTAPPQVDARLGCTHDQPGYSASWRTSRCSGVASRLAPPTTGCSFAIRLANNTTAGAKTHGMT